MELLKILTNSNVDGDYYFAVITLNVCFADFKKKALFDKPAINSLRPSNKTRNVTKLAPYRCPELKYCAFKRQSEVEIGRSCLRTLHSSLGGEVILKFQPLHSCCSYCSTNRRSMKNLNARTSYINQ
jgi:hypothetical protein